MLETRRQILRSKKMKKQDKFIETEEKTYEPGGLFMFIYILFDLFDMNFILIFLFLRLSQNAIFRLPAMIVEEAIKLFTSNFQGIFLLISTIR